MYLMTLCGKNCNKTVYSFKNKDYVIRRDRQNLTSESTQSGPLTLVQQDNFFLTRYGRTNDDKYTK